MTPFHIPAELIERQATAIDVILFVRDERGCPGGAISIAQAKLAEWLLSDPDALPPLLSGNGIDIGHVLSGTPSTIGREDAEFIGLITGGWIGWTDWFSFHIAPASEPPERAGAKGGGAEEVTSLALPPVPFWQGRLGETPSGPLFRTIRLFGRLTMIAGMGLSITLDDSQLAALHAATGEALARRSVRPGGIILKREGEA